MESALITTGLQDIEIGSPILIFLILGKECARFCVKVSSYKDSIFFQMFSTGNLLLLPALHKFQLL